MASVDVSSLSKAEKDELVCAYAALLLHDSDQEITSDKLAKIISASGNDIDPIWPSLFAKAIKGQDVEKLLGF